MNINQINNINFNSRSDKDLTPYNPRKNRRHNIDTLISMNDNEVRRLAYIKTINNTEDKKHRDASKALILSTPLAAGAASALLDRPLVKLFSREITGASARLINGAKGAGKWGIMLGTACGINMLRRYMEDKSPDFERFTNENPFLTFGASVAAFAGTLALGAKGVSKLAETALKNIKPQSIVKFDNKIAKYTDKFNSNSAVAYITGKAKALKDKNWLEPIKPVAAWSLKWSPLLLLGGAFLNNVNHGRAKDVEFVKNYSEIKDFQTRLAKARINELALQNRALKEGLAAQNS